MKSEILNIDFHKRRLMLKALNKYKGNRQQTAIALKITEERLEFLKRNYGIVKAENGYVAMRKLDIMILEEV